MRTIVAPPSVEEELALLLVGTAERRAAAEARIRRLATDADLERLEEFAAGRGVAALVLSRLRELLPHALGPDAARRLDGCVERARLRAGIFATLTARVTRALEQHAIPAVPIKGALLAERLYPDLGRRAPSADIDVLVRACDFHRAVDALVELGYVNADPTAWTRGLPHYHCPLVMPGGAWPAVELHWRVHWYERAFCDAVVQRSLPRHGGRRMAPVDELAVLLLVFVRDGFTSLRIGADLAAWWDAYGPALERPALEPAIAAHPRLGATLTAGAAAAETVLGLPREALVAAHRRPSPRARAAVRLVDWRGRADEDERAVNITLVDLLLTPPVAASGFVRHYWFQPLAKYVADYGWSPRVRLVNELRRAVHVASRALKGLRNYSRRLWELRGGREWDPVPAADRR